MTSYTPPCARMLRRITGTWSSSRTISGARRRSSMDSNSGTTGKVQLSVPAASANNPASLASRCAPSTSDASWVILRMKLPIASRSHWSRSSRVSRNIPSVSAASAGRLVGRSERSGWASSPWSQPRHATERGAGGSPWLRTRHSAVSAASSRALFSRRSSRNVLNRKASTSRRTGRTSSSAAPQARYAVVAHGLVRHLVRDERIAVPVAADPRPELEERRQLERRAGIGLPHGTVELVHELGDDIEQILRDEVQPPGALLRDRGLFQPQLPREPQQLDLRAHARDQGVALAGSPARRFEIDQPAVDAAVLLEHNALIASVRAEIELLWLTGELRLEKPTVA